MKKKILFFVMALMATTLLVPNVNAGTSVAKIGDTGYATLQEAINAASAGDTVTLVANTTEDITIAAGKDITLDTGTYTLTNKTGHTITNSGKLTIKGNGTIDNVTHQKGALVNKGTVTVMSSTFTRSKEAGTRTGNGGNSWYVIDNNGTNAVLIFEGGKVVNTSGFSSLIRNLEATLLVKDGTFENNFIVLKNDDNGTLSIQGGKVSTKAAEGSAVQNWGDFTLKGGELNAVEGAVAISALSWDDQYKSETSIEAGTINGDISVRIYGNTTTVSPEVEISGGEINGDINAINKGILEVTGGEINGTVTSDDTATVTTAGGTYSTKPSDDMIPRGYKVFENDDSTYVVAIPVKITFVYGENSEFVEVPKGTEVSKDEYNTMLEEINKGLESENLEVLGFYLDEDLTEEYTFQDPINEDLTLYLKVQEKKEVNPETSDVNLFLILSLIAIGTVGTTLVLKNRLS